MSLIIIIGAQAVGKMTVGIELEKRIDGKLLFNHQTIDLFANYLGYSGTTFHLSDQTRKNLFTAFVENVETNTTKSIIFTVLIDFNQIEDIEFLKEISGTFLNAQQEVYIIELVADLQERLSRNTHEVRLAMKPSKRNIEFSRKELLESVKKYRLESYADELSNLFPNVNSLKINNTKLPPDKVCDKIISTFDLS